MKQLLVLVTLVLFTSLAFAQTEATVDQVGTANTADIWQSDAGPSNVGGVTKTDADQTAGTTNDLLIKQLNRKSLIDLNQNAATSNYADITQSGNYDNNFEINQTAGGSNYADIYLGQAGGGDIHGNDWFIDQIATGNNDVTVSAAGNHIYSNGKLDLDQTATNGNNYANINMDGDWRRNVKLKSDQTSEDNQLYGVIRGQNVEIDLLQTGGMTNFADFEVQGNNVDLFVDQSSTTGGNILNSYQEGNSSANVFQTSNLGSNTVTITQTK